MARKRERLDVIKDILNAVREHRKIKPTRLLYASNLSPQMFRGYLDELIEKNFIQIIEEEKGKKYFVLTKKGYEFIEEYKLIENFIANFGL